MDKLRRLARRGSLVWVILLLLSAGGTASRVFGGVHSREAPIRKTEGPPAAAVSTGSTLALLDGIPQRGDTLGDPAAPTELIEFADLQCPFCAAVNSVLLPPLIRNYVRTGRVKLVFRDLHFVGPDSERLGKVAGAMAMQDRLWQFVELAFAHQGEENSGYATDVYVTKVLTEIPGTDVDAALAQRDSPAVAEALKLAAEQADKLGVKGTPAFFVAKEGQPPRAIPLQSLDGSRLGGELSQTS